MTTEEQFAHITALLTDTPNDVRWNDHWSGQFRQVVTLEWDDPDHTRARIATDDGRSAVLNADELVHQLFTV